MATPLTAGQFVAALRAEGLTVVELDGWATHNRNHKGPWGPVHGVLIHHTGSDTKDPAGYAQNVLYDGYAGLPGPLCQVGIAPDGVVYLTGYGRCNHAGGGDPAVLDAIIADDMPYDHELTPHRGNSDGIDGNARLYGAEVMYSGGHAMTPEEYDATVRFAAAVCRAHGWTAGSVAGHREWSDDKVDPGQAPLDKLRRDVRARLSQSPKEDPMADPRIHAQLDRIEHFVRVGVNDGRYRLPARIALVVREDSQALIAALKADIVEAVNAAGVGATADEIVDALVGRLKDAGE